VLVAPGDAVTYRLQYALFTSDVEKLSLVDYLPLPVFRQVKSLPSTTWSDRYRRQDLLTLARQTLSGSGMGPRRR
jgi:hypothetical protein